MRKYFFPLAMFLLTALTVAKYRSIVVFKNESREFTFVVSADKSAMSGVKVLLKNISHLRGIVCHAGGAKEKNCGEKVFHGIL